MHVGKEMDALIAERLMGWRVEKKVGTDGTESWWIPQKVACIIKAPWNGMVFIWNPSTDAKAAWEVVEKLREMGWLVTVQVTPDGLMMPESKKPVPAYMATAAYIKGRESTDPAEIKKYISLRPYGSGATVSEAVCRMAVEMIQRGIFEENAECPA